MGSGADYFLHHGRFHPHSFGYRRRGRTGKDHCRPENSVAYKKTLNKLFNQSKGRTMKNAIFFYVVIGLMAGTLLTGCEKTSKQKVENAKENVGDVKKELKDAQTVYLAEWQTFKRESEQTIEANEKRIDAFKGKMEKAGTKFKAKYSKEVAALEQKNRDLKKQLEEYKDEGQSKWEEFKTNFKNDLDAIGKTMKDLFKDND
jgi:predicted RNase H-like nuclease (RuvC/YqgF family)